MANVAACHRLRALDAFVRQDFPTLANALNRELDNGPPDIATLEKALASLKIADPAAQKILTRASQRLQPIVEDYPEATQCQDQQARLQKLP